jgi:hypothetical protein
VQLDKELLVIIEATSRVEMVSRAAVVHFKIGHFGSHKGQGKRNMSICMCGDTMKATLHTSSNGLVEWLIRLPRDSLEKQQIPIGWAWRLLDQPSGAI